MDPALAAIRAAHGTPVDYLPSASAALIPGLNVIWSDVAGEPFQGPGNTAISAPRSTSATFRAARRRKRA